MTLKERLAEVRRRVITDFSDGTGPSSNHWWVCRLCEWVWRDGEAELHEESCPMKEAK